MHERGYFAALSATVLLFRPGTLVWCLTQKSWPRISAEYVDHRRQTEVLSTIQILGADLERSILKPHSGSTWLPG